VLFRYTEKREKMIDLAVETIATIHELVCIERNMAHDFDHFNAFSDKIFANQPFNLDTLILEYFKCPLDVLNNIKKNYSDIFAKYDQLTAMIVELMIDIDMIDQIINLGRSQKLPPEIGDYYLKLKQEAYFIHTALFGSYETRQYICQRYGIEEYDGILDLYEQVKTQVSDDEFIMGFECFYFWHFRVCKALGKPQNTPKEVIIEHLSDLKDKNLLDKYLLYLNEILPAERIAAFRIIEKHAYLKPAKFLPAIDLFDKSRIDVEYSTDWIAQIYNEVFVSQGLVLGDFEVIDDEKYYPDSDKLPTLGFRTQIYNYLLRNDLWDVGLGTILFDKLNTVDFEKIAFEKYVQILLYTNSISRLMTKTIDKMGREFSVDIDIDDTRNLFIVNEIGEIQSIREYVLEAISLAYAETIVPTIQNSLSVLEPENRTPGNFFKVTKKSLEKRFVYDSNLKDIILDHVIDKLDILEIAIRAENNGCTWKNITFIGRQKFDIRNDLEEYIKQIRAYALTLLVVIDEFLTIDVFAQLFSQYSIMECSLDNRDIKIKEYAEVQLTGKGSITNDIMTKEDLNGVIRDGFVFRYKEGYLFMDNILSLAGDIPEIKN
jgi:hypothetical protein